MTTQRPTQYLSAALACAVSLQANFTLAQAPAAPAPVPATVPVATPVIYEELPTLDASVILQPQYFQGANFTVRKSVPSSSGANQYVIDSDYGVFTANGNAMLVRRISEINGIAKLRAVSKGDEFGKAAKRAAKAPLETGRRLIEDPVNTIAAVPKGIVGFLGKAKDAVQGAVENRPSNPQDGGAVAKLTGFSKAKRNLAISVGVDPYSTNEIFQSDLQKVAWPVFSGGFVVNLGMAAVPGGAGMALGAVNLTGNLEASLREKSPSELRKMNLEQLQRIGVADSVANDFLNNVAISPTIQTILVDALSHLGSIPGQTDFVAQAAACAGEYEAVAYMQSAELMEQVNVVSPVARITELGGLPLCETRDGGVIIPIQWDYVAWTPMAEQFALKLKARQFATPVTRYTLMLTGVASPTATHELAKLGITVAPVALPGPLK